MTKQRIDALIIAIFCLTIGFGLGRYLESTRIERILSKHDTFSLNGVKIWCDVSEWRQSR